MRTVDGHETDLGFAEGAELCGVFGRGLNACWGSFLFPSTPALSPEERESGIPPLELSTALR
jgi:hypothetical protein